MRYFYAFLFVVSPLFLVLSSSLVRVSPSLLSPLFLDLIRWLLLPYVQLMFKHLGRESDLFLAWHRRAATVTLGGGSKVPVYEGR